MADRAVLFHRAMPPFEAGDVAGFPEERAQRFVDCGIAEFVSAGLEAAAAEPIVDILTEMDRAALVAFGAEHLGLADAPPDNVSDDDLRAAIRGSVDAEKLAPPPPKRAKK